MWNLFGILTVFISKVYPLLASYKAYESYIATERKLNGSNINIAGFNVPINTLLKRATGEYDEKLPDEAVVLMYHSNKLQKWLIYWIVNTSFDLATGVLLFKYIVPFYSFFKFSVSIWLILPLLQGSGPNNYDAKRDFDQFFNSGCGYCFSYFLKPMLTKESVTAENAELDNKLNQIIDQLINLLLKYTQGTPIAFIINQVVNKSSSRDPSTGEPSSQGAYLDSLRNYGSSKLLEYLKKSTDEPKVEEEYDMVDNPAVAESKSTDFKSTDATGTSTRKRGWLW